MLEKKQKSWHGKKKKNMSSLIDFVVASFLGAKKKPHFEQVPRVCSATLNISAVPGAFISTVVVTFAGDDDFACVCKNTCPCGKISGSVTVNGRVFQLLEASIVRGNTFLTILGQLPITTCDELDAASSFATLTVSCSGKNCKTFSRVPLGCTVIPAPVVG